MTPLLIDTSLASETDALNLANLMRRAARVFPDLPAVFLADEPVADYRTPARRVAGLAGVLQSRFRLAPSNRVALAMNNTPEYIEVLFACWHAGLTVGSSR